MLFLNKTVASACLVCMWIARACVCVCAQREGEKERERWDRAAEALTSQRFRSCYTKAIAKTKPGDEPPQPYTISGHHRLQRPPPRCRHVCRKGLCLSAGVQRLMYSNYFCAFKEILTECGNRGLVKTQAGLSQRSHVKQTLIRQEKKDFLY